MSNEKIKSKEAELEKQEKTEELSLDSLDSVVGGAGLRGASKIDTKPISADTKSKI